MGDAFDERFRARFPYGALAPFAFGGIGSVVGPPGCGEDDGGGADGFLQRFADLRQAEAKPIDLPDAGSYSSAPNRSPRVASDFCAEEEKACRAVCKRAQADFDQPHVWAGSFGKCMKGCMPWRCGGY